MWLPELWLFSGTLGSTPLPPCPLKVFHLYQVLLPSSNQAEWFITTIRVFPCNQQERPATDPTQGQLDFLQQTPALEGVIIVDLNVNACNVQVILLLLVPFLVGCLEVQTILLLLEDLCLFSV